MTVGRILLDRWGSFAVVKTTNEKRTTMETMKRNSVQLMGNLGRDPEVREVKGGRKVAKFSMATNDRWKDGSGNWQDDVQWHPIVAWGKQAERVEQHLRKGVKVSLEGRLVHRSYEGKDGQKRYVTEVVMTDFQLVNTGVEEVAN